MVKKSDKKDFPSALGIVLLIALIILTVCFFAYWGYQWVLYLLGNLFNITTGSTLFDLVAGLIAMISAVFVFVGAIYVWKVKSVSVKLLTVGASGFLLKDLLNLINEVYKLQLKTVLTLADLKSAAGGIGLIFLYMAFWIFILSYFNRRSFKEHLN